MKRRAVKRLYALQERDEVAALKVTKALFKKSYEAPKTLWLFEVSRTQIATGGRVRDDEGAVAVRDDEAVLSVLNDSLKNRPGPFRCPNQLMQP